MLHQGLNLADRRPVSLTPPRKPVSNGTGVNESSFWGCAMAFLGLFLALALLMAAGGFGTSDPVDPVEPGPEPIDGTNDDDTMTGTGNGDLINGYGGNDNIAAGDGNDEVNAGPGDDTVTRHEDFAARPPDCGQVPDRADLGVAERQPTVDRVRRQLRIPGRLRWDLHG